MHFNAKKTGKGKWMALCPSHPDRNRSLGITEGKRGVLIRCWSMGCAVQDIVKAAGLTMDALFYDQGRKLDPKAVAEARRALEAEEKRRSETRIGQWCIIFIRKGYTQEDEDSDMAAIIACSVVLSQKPMRQWEVILRTHLERMEAARHCMERGMLPKMAAPRWEVRV